MVVDTDAPDTLVSNTDGRQVFNAGGVKFQLLEAMRSWRIVFNGLAKRTLNGEVRSIAFLVVYIHETFYYLLAPDDLKETEVHLRINLTWSAFSRPFEFKREFSRKLLAQGMARELWRGRQEWWRMR